MNHRHPNRTERRAHFARAPRHTPVAGLAVYAAIFALLCVLPGCEGAAGEIGDKGVAGAQGAIGARGEAGEAGKAGAPGTDGAASEAGAAGKDGKDGTAGTKGDKGAPGDVASAKGKLLGVVTSATSTKPLAGVKIVGQPGDLSATSDAKGAFDFGDIAIGAYTLTFSRSGHVTKTLPGVGVAALTTHTLAVALELDPVTGATPTVTVSDALAAGFDKDVTLTAVGDDPDGDNKLLTYAWTQLSGPKLAVKGGTTTATLSVHTIKLGATKVVAQARFGVLGLTPMDTGRAVFSIKVTDDAGHVGEAEVVVQATAATQGIANVPPGLAVWLASDAGAKSTTWQLTAPSGSKATLMGATSHFAHFTPDITGEYMLKETISGKKAKVFVGDWSGVFGIQSACKGCHSGSFAPDKFTPWSKTLHATALSAGLDGKSGADFSTKCFACHAVGFSTQAANGGFDDVVKLASWSFGKPAPGTWAKLLTNNADVAKLGNVQCESCHGPQKTSAHFTHAPRVSWSVAVCATCHEQAPNYAKPAQWAASAHAMRDLTVAHATFEGAGLQAADCARCHAAQGYGRYADQLADGQPGLLTKNDGSAADEKFLRAEGLELASVEPVTCTACHDPHGNGNPVQLRIFDDIAALPSGLANVTGAGSGAICMTCHSTWEGEHTDFASASKTWHSGLPSTETDVLYGFNAFFVARHTPSVHLAVQNTCIGCHHDAVAETQSPDLPAGNHGFKADTTICASCHNKKVDGKAFQGAVGSQLADLGQAIGGKARAIFAGAIQSSGKLNVRAWDPKTKLYSSKSGANVALSAAPTTAAPVSISLMSGWKLSLPSKVDITWTDGSKTSVTELWVTSQDLTAGGKPVFTPTHLLLKAAWNHQLLTQDGSRGVHNPGFYQAVLAATQNAIK